MLLEVFTDFVCPWCYLGIARLDAIRREIDFDVRWVYFPLHPETPREGLTLEELFDGRDFDIEAAHQRMYALMEAEGLPHGTRTHTYNSRLAQELAKWAATLDAPRDLDRALYAAYFVDGRNIGDTEVLLEIVRSAGLPDDEARDALENRTFRAAVDADWKKADQYGIRSVPTFVAGDRGIAGAQPTDILRSFIQKAIDADASEERSAAGDAAG